MGDSSTPVGMTEESVGMTEGAVGKAEGVVGKAEGVVGMTKGVVGTMLLACHPERAKRAEGSQTVCLVFDLELHWEIPPLRSE